MSFKNRDKVRHLFRPVMPLGWFGTTRIAIVPCARHAGTNMFGMNTGAR